MTRFLAVETVKEINDELSGLGVLNPTSLTSAVMEPQAGAFGEEFHPTLHDKAAALLRGLARNHAFHDGNKRTALVATDTFLRLNGKMLDAPQDQLVEFIVDVAQGMYELDQIAKQLQVWSVPLEIDLRNGTARGYSLELGVGLEDR